MAQGIVPLIVPVHVFAGALGIFQATALQETA
jgi:hypothetical protein